MRILWLLTACRPDDPPPQEQVPLWSEEDGAIVLAWDGTPRLRVPVAAFEVGVVDSYVDTRSYDPWWPMDDVLFLPARSATVDDGVLRLDFAEAGTGVLSVTPAAVEGSWDLTLTPPSDRTVAAWRISPRVSASDGFYGLGEFPDTPEHRGKRRAMQLEIDTHSGSGYNEAHVPVPLLVGTSGWGFFAEDDHPAVFDVATVQEDVFTYTVGVGPDGDQPLRLHLYAAARPLDVYAGYHATTGAPGLPAPWALGPLVWRNENDDQAQVERDLRAMRDLDLPATGVWIDRPYATGVNTFDFEAARFPDPAAMIGLAHDLGFRMALWHTPYADPTGAAEVHDLAVDGGWYAPDSPPPLTDWGPLIDLTNPAAVDGWRGLLQRYADLGIEGYKLDFAEDVVVGLAGNRLPWRFFDGRDERTLHKDYIRRYHETYRAALPDDGGFLLCRAGTWGDHTRGCVIWPGDLDATLEVHGVEAVDRHGETYTTVGGLPAALAAGLSVNASGFPFYASDTGGYRHAPPDKETFSRWFAQTAFSPAMQIGVASSDVAWEYTDENGFDDEMLGWYRDYTRWHLRLWPFLWSLAQEAHQRGTPIARAYGLQRPELGLHPADVYFLGDSLLVAPVVTAGAVERDVPVPPGRWIHWFTGEIVEGPAQRAVSAPLGSLPAFLGEGGVVPLLRPTVDTLAPVADPDAVDSFATDPGALYVRIFPGEGAFQVYDGATIQIASAGSGFALGSTQGDTFDQGLVYEVIGTPRPASVTLDGLALAEDDDPAATVGWSWTNRTGGTLWIHVPPGDHTVAWP